MNNQFIFFCVNVGNENLLKEEIRIFYPELNLSYSRKGFITYKNTGVKYDLKSISQLDCTFSTRAGICLGKSNSNDLIVDLSRNAEDLELKLEDCIVHNFSVNTDFELEAAELLNTEVNGYSANDKIVFDLISLGEKELWIGVHSVTTGTTRYPNSKVDVYIPPAAPSKAYLKMAQVIELYSIKINPGDRWLDFGCAPGGSTHYLLSNGAKVWGIDTAQMPQVILDETNFNFINKPAQDLSQEELPADMDWIHVDLNLNPKQAVKEVLRLAKKYNFSLKGILFTVQLTKIEYIELIEEFEDSFFDWGFTDILSRQVPSHKKEYVIIAKRDR